MRKYFYLEPSFTRSTWALLAITRFSLSFIVLYAHLYAYIFGFKSNSVQFILDLGPKAAVVAFLLISGISIGHSFAKNKKGFFTRRFLRIYPLYFIAVLFAVVLQIYLGSPYNLPNSTIIAAGHPTSIANFFLLQGIVAIPIIYNGPLWSIGVEVFLYLMVPLFLQLQLRHLLLITGISMLFFIYFDFNLLFGYVNFIWAWPFLIGLIIATKKQPWYIITILGICLLLIVLSQRQVFKGALGVLTVSFSFVVSLLSMYLKLNFSSFTLRLFNFLGTISYPIYVFHLPLYILLYHLGIRNSYAFIGLVIVSSIAINYIFDIWLKEVFWKPVLRKFNSIYLLIVKQKADRVYKV